MNFRTISACLLAATLAISVTSNVSAQIELPTAPDPAIADMTPEQLVETRQETMKAGFGVLRSAETLSGADAVAGATKLVVNFTNFPALFREGSIVGESKALPAIWEQWDTFLAVADKARTLSVAAVTAAEAGDNAAFGAAMKEVGQVCGECHQPFRGK